ncbi:unnamed protein product [Clonostachys rhizophaga]|uniref:Major facilitator superfamily (MFS) profile domain-containing protein n=1 Tax=Clonostachys rhizophaga TaxID=160324 RepID=A0A9N9YJP2_9HYPO|nr:unnamed protein product [Clonostachys rhizophaga]
MTRRGTTTSTAPDGASLEAPEQPSYPPVDGGRDAWLVLTAATMMESLIWGFPFAFGVFQEYYSRQELFADSIHQLATIGTCATVSSILVELKAARTDLFSSQGLMYLSAPIVYSTVRKVPRYRKAVCIVGFVVTIASLIGASFASTFSQLLVLQGILYALGGSLLYFPTIIYIDEWFSKRKGFAWGIIIAGGGASGIVIPFLMEWILDTWGFPTAFRVWSVIFTILTIPALFYLKPRLYNNQFDADSNENAWAFFKSPAFWIFSAGNLVQSMGYFMPLLYLPSFAVAQGWPRMTGTIALALCNAANVVGAITVGWLADHYHITTAINFCALGTMCAVFLFWSFAVYQPVVYVFAFTYGLFAGGVPATWSGCSNPIRRHYQVEAGMIISLFTAVKGVGSLISGPLSGVLVASDSWKGRAEFAYGSGYGYLIIFSGITASFAATGWVGKRLGLV